MIKISGKHNEAICYCDELEDTAAAQIRTLCQQSAFADSRIRIMPDVHAGMGCTIGTTMSIHGKIVPGMVGVDIGCGMETVQLLCQDLDKRALDEVIHLRIPSGRSIRNTPHAFNDAIELEQLLCASNVNLGRARLSIGSLGGGNHFIELNQGANGALYLVVHTGSRHLGKEVAEYYQNLAYKQIHGTREHDTIEVLTELKAQNRFSEIGPALEKLKKSFALLPPKELSYLSGALFDDYLHDMKIVQHFASLNRKAIVESILEAMNWSVKEQFTTIHNYIDTEAMLLRKGAVSAQKGEKLLIPINMRDGSLICEGKGNPDWNCSAPHGAGRLLSRSAAMKKLSLAHYQEEMQGVYTTCVCKETLDESPMAYKSQESITKHIGPTATILEQISPLYNFKASE